MGLCVCLAPFMTIHGISMWVCVVAFNAYTKSQSEPNWKRKKTANKRIQRTNERTNKFQLITFVLIAVVMQKTMKNCFLRLETLLHCGNAPAASRGKNVAQNWRKEKKTNHRREQQWSACDCVMPNTLTPEWNWKIISISMILRRRTSERVSEQSEVDTHIQMKYSPRCVYRTLTLVRVLCTVFCWCCLVRRVRHFGNYIRPIHLSIYLSIYWQRDFGWSFMSTALPPEWTPDTNVNWIEQ